MNTAPTPERQAYLDQMWRLVLAAPDDAAQKALIARLPEDVISDMRKYKNPMRAPVVDDGNNRYLQFSILDMTKKYKERFLMTSLIGFINRMADEYEPEEASSYTSEDDAVFANVFNVELAAFTKAKPVDVLRAIMTAEPGNLPVARALHKYQSDVAGDDLAKVRDQIEVLTGELRAAEMDLPIAHETVRLARIHYEKRKAADAAEPAARKAMPRDDIVATLGPADTELVDRMNKDKKTIADLKPVDRDRITAKHREILPIEAYSKALATFEVALSAAHAAVPPLEAKIAETRAKLDAARATEATHLATLRDLGLHRAANFGIDAISKGNGIFTPVPKDLEPTDEEIDAITQRVKLQLGITMTREEYLDDERDRITRFLDSLFIYNPDNHVRSAYAPNYADTTRHLPEARIEELRQAASVKYSRTLIPPKDTFARWNRYTDANYEELRQATDDIYSERSDIEWSIVPLNVVAANSEADATELAREYQRKHAEEFEASVYTAKFNKWTLLPEFKVNRERIEFLNKDTEVLRRILEQNKIDAEQGRNMVKKRGERMKASEAKSAPGGDAIGLHAAAGALAGDDLRKYGAKPMDELEIPRDHGQSTRDELEVGVHSFRPRFAGKNKRRIRGTITSSKFHVPTEAPEAGASLSVTDQQGSGAAAASKGAH